MSDYRSVPASEFTQSTPRATWKDAVGMTLFVGGVDTGAYFLLTTTAQSSDPEAMAEYLGTGIATADNDDDFWLWWYTVCLAVGAVVLTGFAVQTIKEAWQGSSGGTKVVPDQEMESVGGGKVVDT